MALLRNLINSPKRGVFHNVFNFAAQRRYIQTVVGAEECPTPHSRGLVLGVYSDENDLSDMGMLTPMASMYDERVCKGRVLHLLRISGPMPRRGECRIFYDLEPHFQAIAVCGLGDKCLGYDAEEQIDEGKEAIRIASATGCRALQQLHTSKIAVESFGNSECAAEGGSLGLWRYQGFKGQKTQEFMPQLEMHVEPNHDFDFEGWTIGLHKASAQNLARQLMDAPPNKLTPTKFAQNVIQALCDSGVSIEVKVRDWAETNGFSSFLAISKGSLESPIFLELSYNGSTSSDRPIVLVGQGTTYDSGGVCLRKPDELMKMKGEICGAACVVATCRAIAAMRLPVNIRGLIPLCEHMIGASAIKSGDIVKSQKGSTVEIENTANAGVLVMNDTLSFAEKCNPKLIIDVGTTSNDIDETLGAACAGVFTNDDNLWQKMKFAGVHTGDRMWRMPLWNYFNKQIRASTRADLQNVGIGRGGGACKSAAFLSEYIPNVPWLHIDAHGIITTNGTDFPYLKNGMAGRPTRTLIEFIAQTTCNQDPTVKSLRKSNMCN